MTPEMGDAARIEAFLDHPDVTGLDVSASSMSACLPFFRDGVAPGGHVLLDLWRGKPTEQIAELRRLGAVRDIGGGTKAVRVALTRGVE